MKIKIELELQTLPKGKEGSVSEKEIKENLTQNLFDVCEEWVLNGKKPNLEFCEV